MSVVTNIIVAYSLSEEDRHGDRGEWVVERLNEFFGPEEDGFVLPAGDWWYGGSKALENPILVGAFNHLDLFRFLSHVAAIDWEEPDRVQVMAAEQEDGQYAVWNLTPDAGASPWRAAPAGAIDPWSAVQLLREENKLVKQNYGVQKLKNRELRVRVMKLSVAVDRLTADLEPAGETIRSLWEEVNRLTEERDAAAVRAHALVAQVDDLARELDGLAREREALAREVKGWREIAAESLAATNEPYTG